VKRLEAAAAAIFGIGFLLLAFAVAVETMMRKVFNRSLQGVDELGGYILAGGAALAMAAALVSRAHIRIDLLHDYMPRTIRIALNVAASLALLACAALLARMAWIALDESILFNSTAQTPWATPLWIPQSVWFGALLLFCLVAASQAAWLLWLAVRGQSQTLDRSFGPRGAKDELEDELEDLRKRGGGTA
jgi:TRAP-type C4-dicarboxylate transport system permease small subunit